MTQDEVHQHVRRLAAERGGKLSMRVFFAETGLNAQWLRSQTWFGGWNDLVSGLELEPQKFSNPRIPLTELARAVAALAVRIGRWPTEDDLRRARRSDSGFPGLDAIRPHRKSGALAQSVVQIGSEDPALGGAVQLATPHIPSGPLPDSDRASDRIQGYVYLLRSGRRYKVGKSNDPSRRFREVKLELPDESHHLHSIATDDPSGIEAYWHRRFAATRVRNTEFFELSGDDVKAFCRRTYQ